MLKFIKKVILSLILISIVNIYAEVIEKDDYKIINETYKGSKIEIAVSEKLTGNVFIYCHGMRAGGGELTVSVYPDGELTKELLRKGWICAATSYRRNGKILKDAVEDIEFLREYIEEKYGKQKNVYLLGSSMGGTIVSLLAEKTDGNYTGIIALGASMTLMEDDKSKNIFTNKPQVPILFLTNQSELKRPQEYIDAYKGEKFEPVLWKVKRNGHCNTNDKEELLALNALMDYIQTGKIEKNKEVLIEMKAGPSTAVFKKGKAFVEVMKISETYGTITADIRKEDFEKLGINHGDYYEIGSKDKTWRILWGTTYSDVPYNYWISFFDAKGNFKIARNYRNAARPLQCNVGDDMYIQKSDNPDKIEMTDEDKKLIEMNGKAIEKLMAKDYKGALEITYQIRDKDPEKVWPYTNIAHFLLLDGKFEEAKNIYMKHKGTKLYNGSFYFEDTILDDFDDLKGANLYHPDFDKIKKLYGE